MTFKSFVKPALDPRAIAAIFLAIIFSACSKPPVEKSPVPEFQDSITRERVEKNEAFKSNQDSPIPAKDRAGFVGLSYYPVDPGLKFSAMLHRYPSPRQVQLSTNTGEIRRGLRYGYFEFQVGTQICRIQVYRLEDTTGGKATLFIPFRDATSGKETYGAGRYMDLEENTTGIYDLDFNRAYNPYCAYNSDFSCPIPPAENNLSVPIRAGEKKFSSGQAH